MSRRHLSLLIVAIASMVISACGTSPTAPRPNAGAADTTSRLGVSGSNG